MLMKRKKKKRLSRQPIADGIDATFHHVTRGIFEQEVSIYVPPENENPHRKKR